MDFPLMSQSFHTGGDLDAYRTLGAHPAWEDGREGYVFRTWAPGAKWVEVIGEWNGWQGQPLYKNASGVWSGFCPGACKGQMYKFRITGADGVSRDKADPYAFRSELRPGTASVLWDLAEVHIRDEGWMSGRDKCYDRPLNIYELHAGSWRRNADGSWLNYAQLADQLVPYLKEMNFNFVELLPLSEHPFDGSWGYQTSGYFSLTSRYGTPAQFGYFVEKCHQNGIGVIMDFVPVHFVPDGYALCEYDGTALYEYDSDVGHSEWGSRNFNFYRGEVRSFLASAAAFWLDVYHCDGIRMDAICNAIYWQGDPVRGVNRGGVEFLQQMNQALHKRWPAAILVAEDSSNYLKVTAPVAYGGLGFDYKWDMGWMHDTLDYFATPFGERAAHYHKLTFSMQYFHNELYLPAFSHDEVVHGKKTIIDKMWGSYEEKFAQVRLLYLYMFTHPGKKLNFMGGEIAQWREWDEEKALDECLLAYPLHDAFRRYFSALGAIYTQQPALYQGEYDTSRFQWLVSDDRAQGVYAYLRRDEGQDLLVVLNTQDKDWEEYRIGVPYPCVARPLIASQDQQWGGTAGPLPGPVQSQPEGWGLSPAGWRWTCLPWAGWSLCWRDDAGLCPAPRRLLKKAGENFWTKKQGAPLRGTPRGGAPCFFAAGMCG